MEKMTIPQNKILGYFEFVKISCSNKNKQKKVCSQNLLQTLKKIDFLLSKL